MRRVLSLFLAIILAAASVNFTVAFADNSPIGGKAENGKYAWVFGSDADGGASKTYDFRDEYAEIRVGTGTGDSITAADGIKWSGGSCKENDVSGFENAGVTNRYILINPTYTGTLSITTSFPSAGDKVAGRWYYNDFGENKNFDDVDLSSLEKNVGTQIDSDFKSTASKTITLDVTAGHTYSLHNYVYKGGVYISDLFYTSEDIIGKAATPTINTPISSADTSISGTCVDGAAVKVKINNGEAQNALVTGTVWSLDNLKLNPNDTITVTAQKEGEYESNAATAVVTDSSDVFALTINDTENGQITSNQADNSRIVKDREVTLTAVPYNGYKLKTLTVDGNDVEAADNTYTFTMTKDITVSAEFEEKIYYDITLPQNTPNGTVEITGGNENGKAMSGENITLSAKADSGYRLKELTYSYGQNEPVSIKYAREFTMPESAVTISAQFEETKIISEVDTSLSKNDRLTLDIDGEPFFYNGIQLRADKVANSWGYDNDKIEYMFKQSAEDGFSVVNTQITWHDIQPNTEINAVSSETVSNGAYMSFTLPAENINYAAAKVKINVTSAAGVKPHLYGVNENYEKGTELTQDNSVDLGTLPSWNEITKTGSYDFDVTDFVNNADGTVGFVLTGCDNITFTPTLILSRDDVYDWSYVDRMIDNSAKYGLKLEILWFAIDTCQQTAESRVPWYVINNYQKTLREDKTPIRQGDNGGFTYLMCKNDKLLRVKEQEVLETLFNHIAKYDSQNGNKHTVVGCQLTNEPATARTHNGDDHYNERCHCDVCEEKYNSFIADGKSLQDYLDDTMYYYENSLGEAVKLSDYSVWTRVNNYGGTDANLVAYNENKRANGGTYIDFIGYDPYKQDTATMFNFGNTITKMTKVSVNYSQGKNLPMVMENGGNYTNSASLALAALAGSSFYNVYEFGGPDNFGLYDKDASSANGFKAHGGYIDEVRATNDMLNKIAPVLASYKADGAGGKRLTFFNALSDNSASTKKTVRAIPIIYNTQNNGVGIAAAVSDKEIVFESSKAAEFVLTGAKDYDIASAETGAYENGVWTKTADKEYSENENDIVIAANEYDCFKLTFTDSIPESYIPNYDYNNETDTYTYDFSKFSDSLSLSTSARISNMTICGADGDYINPSAAVYKDANGNETCEGGIWWNGKGDSGNRYIAYKAERSGTLALRLRRTYNTGSTAKSYLRYGTQKAAGTYIGASAELN